jgi:hypothetical protein
MNDELSEGRLKPTAPMAIQQLSVIHHSSFITHHFLRRRLAFRGALVRLERRARLDARRSLCANLRDFLRLFARAPCLTLFEAVC